MKIFPTYAFVLALIVLLLFPGVLMAQGLVPCDGPDCSFAHVIQLIETVIDFLIFTLAFPIATALFAYAGILMITAGGKEEQIKKAKRVFWHVAVGLLIMLAAWLIVYTITTTLLDTDLPIKLKRP